MLPHEYFLHKGPNGFATPMRPVASICEKGFPNARREGEEMGSKKSCEIARRRVTTLQDIVTKIHPKSCLNQPKIELKSAKIKARRGPEGDGARSGSHSGPQGGPGGPKCPKTTFEGHPGTSL